jgi:hypothetical protein
MNRLIIRLTKTVCKAGAATQPKLRNDKDTHTITDGHLTHTTHITSKQGIFIIQPLPPPPPPRPQPATSIISISIKHHHHHASSSHVFFRCPRVCQRHQESATTSGCVAFNRQEASGQATEGMGMPRMLVSKKAPTLFSLLSRGMRASSSSVCAAEDLLSM